MKIDLHTHDADCTPINPGHCCRITSFIRTSLGDAKWRELLALIQHPERTSVPADRDEKLEHEISVEFPELSARARVGLQHQQINTVRQLVQCTEMDILRIPNFGRKTLNELKYYLDQIGWKLGELPKED